MTKTANISAWRRFCQLVESSRSSHWSVRALLIMILMAFFAPFIANNKPILCKYKNEWHFPVLRAIGVEMGIVKRKPELDHLTWINTETDFAMWPPFPYNAQYADKLNTGKSPFDKQRLRKWWHRHWLGTDIAGKDLLANLVWGTRTAILVGLGGMLLAGLIGVLLGALAGYWGNHRLEMPRKAWGGLLIGLALGFFWAFMSRVHLMDTGQSNAYWLGGLCILCASTTLGYWIGKVMPWHSKPVHLPIDSIIMRIIETIKSIPGLLLVLVLVNISSETTLLSVILIVGLLSWTNIARFVRGELLRIRELEYMQAAQALGFSSWRQLFVHALPNAMTPVYIALAFGIASAILLEASLSFLGIGLSHDVASWGKMLSHAHQTPKMWWLAVFPGLSIFITVASCNIIGDKLN